MVTTYELHYVEEFLLRKTSVKRDQAWLEVCYLRSLLSACPSGELGIDATLACPDCNRIMSRSFRKFPLYRMVRSSSDCYQLTCVYHFTPHNQLTTLYSPSMCTRCQMCSKSQLIRKLHHETGRRSDCNACRKVGVTCAISSSRASFFSFKASLLGTTVDLISSDSIATKISRAQTKP